MQQPRWSASDKTCTKTNKQTINKHKGTNKKEQTKIVGMPQNFAKNAAAAVRSKCF